MKNTNAALLRGFAKLAELSLVKTASMTKEARRRWLEDQDLVKLCRLCKEKFKSK